uniref:Uncharacterized protein n=1 Tax=candidate division WOR-3 bacterium TaxID=2052148 RepID=A0A7C4U807_UNCW3
MNLDEILKNIKEFYPEERERYVIENLFKMWLNNGGIQTYSSEIPENVQFPLAVDIGVIAADWPGLSDAITGAFHEKGWNIFYEKGFIIEYGDKKLGVIIIVIKIEDNEELKKFLEERQEIIENIRFISIGSVAKKMLLSQETKRLEIYSKVVDLIEKKAERDLLNELLSPEGEVFKFFASRSRAYIEQRTVEDLAEQIINNARLIKNVRDSKGEIQIWIKNMKTFYEELTGITIGAFERDLNLKEILDALSYSIGEFKVKFNKEFTTSDGVYVARLEITDIEDKPVEETKFQRIISTLTSLWKKKKIEKAERIDFIGGFEHYIRAIIPFLVNEFQKTKIPQIYISSLESTEFYVDFKIIFVLERNFDISKILDDIVKSKFFFLQGIHPKKLFGEASVHIIDLRVETPSFYYISEVYDGLKEIFKKYLPNFRDFDEGLRKMDVQKLERILERIKNIPRDLVKEFYYSIEDFFRVSETDEGIETLIILGYEALVKARSERNTAIYKNLDTGTYIGIAYENKELKYNKIIELFKDFELTFSRVIKDDYDVIMMKVSLNNLPLPDDKMKSIIESMEI